MIHYQTHVSVIAIVTGESTILVLLKNGNKVCAVLFDFWSYCFIVYINLFCLNIQGQATTQFSLWLPLSRVSVIGCTTKYDYKVCVVLFDFYSTQYKVYIHLPCIITQQRTKATLNSSHATSSSGSIHWNFIRGQPIVVRDIVTWI